MSEDVEGLESQSKSTAQGDGTHVGMGTLYGLAEQGDEDFHGVRILQHLDELPWQEITRLQQAYHVSQL
jgi:hypothetical protein